MLTIAISKGRLQDDTLALFARAGIEADDSPLSSRRLLIKSKDGRCSFVFVKPADVPTYVEYGVADAGVCGRRLVRGNPRCRERMGEGEGDDRQTEKETRKKKKKRVLSVSAMQFFLGNNFPLV